MPHPLAELMKLDRERLTNAIVRQSDMDEVTEIEQIMNDFWGGVTVGRESLPWHIEFTTCHTHLLKPSPTEDDLLVLYYPDNAEWEQVCARMVGADFVVVPSLNPYRDANGCTFADPDGYRVVICNKGWVTVAAD